MMPVEFLHSQLAHDGVAKVKANLATNVYPSNERPYVIEWLERASEATTAEQLALARRAADEASEATKLAKTAVKIAIASIAIAILGTAIGVVVPHFWH
jgi:hypothetical protein